MPRPYKYRDLIKKLQQYDPLFEVFARRGKGSERMLYHPDVDGRPESFPVKCHKESQDLTKGVVSAIKRRFRLPDDLL